MIALVLSRARHLLSSSVFGSSLAGDGLLVRLRSTSIGLLGVVTAVGLGLVAFISQLGWPGVFNAPIPGSPHEAARVHDAIALTRQAPPIESALPTRNAPAPTGSRPALSPGGAAGVGGPGADSGIGGSHGLGGSGGAQTPSPVEQPPVAAAPESTSQPVAVVPVAAPAAPQPSATGGPSTSGSGSGVKDGAPASPKPPNGTAGVKPAGDTSEEPVTPSPEKLKNDKDHWPAKTYPDHTKSGYIPSKPSEDKTKTPPTAVVPPVTTPSPKDLPEEVSAQGDGKDSGYADKSEKRRH